MKLELMVRYQAQLVSDQSDPDIRLFRNVMVLKQHHDDKKDRALTDLPRHPGIAGFIEEHEHAGSITILACTLPSRLKSLPRRS